MSGKQLDFGWLDANIFIHPLFTSDPHRPGCMAVLDAILQGRATGWLDAVTLHELTYALPRALPRRFATRQDVYAYLMGYLTCETLQCDDKEALMETLRLWVEAAPRFGDARLLARARTRDMPVCTVNGKDFPGARNTYDAQVGG